MWLFSSLLLITVLRNQAHPPPCKIIETNKIICEKYFNLTFTDNNIKTIEIHDLDSDEINLNDVLELYPNLENFTVNGGEISSFLEPNHKNNIRYLQLNNAGVENITEDFLDDDYLKLETLDLRDNRIQELNRDLNWGELQNLYISGNQWNCSKDLSWVLDFAKIIRDIDKLECYDEPHPGKPLLKIAEIVEKIKAQCPSNCYCWLPKIVRNPETDALEPIIEVNCSNKNLQQFPESLPENTRILHLENNEIEDLSPLKTNSHYNKLLDLYLDNNKITRIEDLEGSYWLCHFRVFSLSGNKITELPTYALDNALEQNPNMPNALMMFLGRNPWRCDCVFTPVFQEMLQKFAGQIQDISQIKCSYVEGDENSLLPINDLSRSSVCRLPSEYSIQVLDVVNGILATLIILIVGKFAYDYYYYKITGKLPTIATKMP